MKKQKKIERLLTSDLKSIYVTKIIKTLLHRQSSSLIVLKCKWFNCINDVRKVVWRKTILRVIGQSLKILF